MWCSGEKNSVAAGLKPSANTSRRSPATVAKLLCVKRLLIAHTYSYHAMCKHHLSYCVCFSINVCALTLSSVVVQSSCKEHATFNSRRSASPSYNWRPYGTPNLAKLLKVISTINTQFNSAVNFYKQVQWSFRYLNPLGPGIRKVHYV